MCTTLRSAQHRPEEIGRDPGEIWHVADTNPARDRSCSIRSEVTAHRRGLAVHAFPLRIRHRRCPNAWRGARPLRPRFAGSPAVTPSAARGTTLPFLTPTVRQCLGET